MAWENQRTRPLAIRPCHSEPRAGLYHRRPCSSLLPNGARHRLLVSNRHAQAEVRLGQGDTEAHHYIFPDEVVYVYEAQVLRRKPPRGLGSSLQVWLFQGISPNSRLHGTREYRERTLSSYRPG